MHFAVLKKWLCLFGIWSTDLKQRFHSYFTFLLRCIFILQFAIILCTVKSYRFCWHLNAFENCPNFLRTHNFKLDCVKTFLEGEGRKWIFIKHLLCAFFFVSWVFYMSIHFSVSNIILILPLRKLRLSNWSMATLLEIAEPESNPGLLNSKAWALVHIVGRQDFATTGWSLRDHLIQQGKPSLPLHLPSPLPNTHISQTRTLKFR